LPLILGVNGSVGERVVDHVAQMMPRQT
jgi:hypothetical protein